LFVEDLAREAGHTLDWTRSSAERNNLVAVAAGNGDYEPMWAVLIAVAGGTAGVDRDVEALDDLDKLLHSLSASASPASTCRCAPTASSRPRTQRPGDGAGSSPRSTQRWSKPRAGRRSPRHRRWRGSIGRLAAGSPAAHAPAAGLVDLWPKAPAPRPPMHHRQCEQDVHEI
jgi:hypothetical protein